MIHRIKEFIIIILGERRKEYKESYLVSDVNHYNFVELESRVLSNPVRVENAKTSTTTTDTFLNK